MSRNAVRIVGFKTTWLGNDADTDQADLSVCLVHRSFCVVLLCVCSSGLIIVKFTNT